MVERISGNSLGFHCTNSDPDGRYSISKEVITDPHLPCVLQRTRLTGPDEKFLTTLKLFALCAPHIQVGGYGNRLRDHCERLADTHGLQAGSVARDDRHGPFFPNLLWLRGKGRWFLAKQLGFYFEGFGWHSFRRQNLTLIQEEGASAFEAMVQAGQKDPPRHIGLLSVGCAK
jgi:hypothetical protein